MVWSIWLQESRESASEKSTICRSRKELEAATATTRGCGRFSIGSRRQLSKPASIILITGLQNNCEDRARRSRNGEPVHPRSSRRCNELPPRDGSDSRLGRAEPFAPSLLRIGEQYHGRARFV